ncbi:NAD(P)H-dependent oxidoreductase [Mesorhizobium atlanticum]
MPAIAQAGWADRVFASGGRIYGGGKWYDRGVFAGKRAMCSVTIGGPPPILLRPRTERPDQWKSYSPSTTGFSHFVGLTVIEPFLVHAPARISDLERQIYLARYRERILDLPQASTIPYPKLADFDVHHVLKSN